MTASVPLTQPIHSAQKSQIMTQQVVTNPLHVAMIPWMVAGIKTHYLNVRAVAETQPEVSLRTFEVYPHVDGGRLERLPLPNRVKSNLRCQMATLPALRTTPLDVVWTQTLNATIPFLLTRGARGRVPVIYDIDVTPRLLASFGAQYAEQVKGSRLKRRVVDAVYRRSLRRVAAVVAWSVWAARSFEQDYGVSAERIHVMPPGVDLSLWAPPSEEARRARAAEWTPRLLFVGADFERKGGDLLLEVFRRHFVGRCELHIVTKAAIPSEAGVWVHHDLGPNDPRLRKLYETSDALVLPTRADCFSLASIEAMAMALPVVTTALGGIPEIVTSGKTGYLVAPGSGVELRAAIEALLSDRERSMAMGLQGRVVAETRFDAQINAQRLLALLRAVKKDSTS